MAQEETALGLTRGEYDDLLIQCMAFDQEAYGPRDSLSYVYFVRAVGTQFVKIGWAADPHQRLAELQTGSAHLLALVARVPGGPRHESALHRRFAHLRVRGEWFQLDETLANFIALFTGGAGI